MYDSRFNRWTYDDDSGSKSDEKKKNDELDKKRKQAKKPADELTEVVKSVAGNSAKLFLSVMVINLVGTATFVSPVIAPLAINAALFYFGYKMYNELPDRTKIRISNLENSVAKGIGKILVPSKPKVLDKEKGKMKGNSLNDIGVVTFDSKQKIEKGKGEKEGNKNQLVNNNAFVSKLSGEKRNQIRDWVNNSSGFTSKEKENFRKLKFEDAFNNLSIARRSEIKLKFDNNKNSDKSQRSHQEIKSKFDRSHTKTVDRNI